MTVKTGQTIAGSFCTVSATGALTAATGTPVGTLYVAGVANAATVTIAGSNPYSWSVTLPALAAGDIVQMYITATISAISAGGFVWDDVADTGLISDVKAKTDYLPSVAAGASGGVFIAGANAATSITTALTANITGNLSGSVGSVTGAVGSVASGGITAASIAADAIGASELAADAAAEIAAAAWAYATRTLTQSATTVSAALAGDTISILRGDTTSIAFTGLGNITGYSKLWFAVKSDSRNDADTASIIYVTLAGGLIYLNGAAASTATDASMTVVDATTGAVTVTLKAALTAALQVQGGLSYDVQWLDGDGHIHTLTSGTAAVTADVARATS